MMVSRFIDVCRRSLKVNADKSKVMVLGILECEIYSRCESSNICGVCCTNQEQTLLSGVGR